MDDYTFERPQPAFARPRPPSTSAHRFSRFSFSSFAIDDFNVENYGFDGFTPVSRHNTRNSDAYADRLSKANSIIEAEENKGDPYAHLTEHEASILKRQVEVPYTSVGYGALLSYATKIDWIIMAGSGICAIAAGVALPFMTVIFGQLTGTFTSYVLGNITEEYMNQKLDYWVIYFIYLAIIEFFAVYFQSIGFIYTGEHIASKIRSEYLSAVMRQNIGFFDKLGSGEITTRITSDTNLVQESLSEKVGLTLTAVATFATAFIIGFVTFWKLSLILLSGVFLIIVIMAVGSFFIVKFERARLEAYGHGGTIAEEVFSSIRNAQGFGTQEKLVAEYDQYLVNAEKLDIKAKITIGMNIGAMFSIIYLNYSLAFYTGSIFVNNKEMVVGNVLTILMSIMIGAFALGNVAPHIQAFTTGISAAANIFATIRRVSPMDPMSKAGIVLDKVEGRVELRNIKHIYPSRPEVTILKSMTLNIPAGKMTALVGASGSGKSTIVGLLERFYDPVGGQIFLDGHDISTLNVKWLRQQMALVSQEPTLFNTSIYGNIRHGIIGSRFEFETDENKQRDLVINAAKMANAHDFIMTLPEGYDTNVGERGLLLSGGQKQRIAIARAVISDPKIMLLDEATSALDTKSEGVVQAALDDAAAGRTTITIAHRLSTIKKAENIVVMGEGCILEQGTHDELLRRKGAYYELIEAQKINSLKDDVTTDDEKKQLAILHGDDHSDSASVKEMMTGLSSGSETEMSHEDIAAETQKNYSLWTLIKVVAAFNKEEWYLMVLALFLCVICGGGNPTQAVFFGKEVVALANPDPAQVTSGSKFWSLMYLMLAIVQFCAYSGQGVAFAICSARLIHRARIKTFRSILRQDIEFFDRTEVGALTSFLSTEATLMAGLSGVTLGTILTVTTTLVTAIAVSCALGWKLALVCTATIPILLLCGYFRFWLLGHLNRRAKRAFAASASYACEATSSIRIIASLTREEEVLTTYRASLAEQASKTILAVTRSSILYAMSQSVILLCIGLGFWYGGTLIASHEYGLLQFFICFSAIIFGAQSAGTIFSFAPDMGKSKSATAELKYLFDRVPAIDAWSEKGTKLDYVAGKIEFRDVHFSYPTRPGQPVLRGLNLTVKPGQYIALVGASGCGKSTTIALLERFYNPSSGGIYIDDKEIRDLNLADYRSHIALVSQEPTLYQGSIRHNILLGTNREDVTDDEIKYACIEANIYEFVMSLPDGFNTIVGSKGSMLSGGQKQRIAIARALLRDPRILLLDEATSALDSESEHVVQAALDAAAHGRTTIAVAHRLSTIQKADVIYVFDAGRVVEHGTHVELMRLGGRYSELVNMQSLSAAR